MNRLCLFLLFTAAVLCGCADKPPARPSANHFSAPSVGGSPSGGMNGFVGVGSWHPGGPSMRPAEADHIKGYRGF